MPLVNDDGDARGPSPSYSYFTMAPVAQFVYSRGAPVSLSYHSSLIAYYPMARDLRNYVLKKGENSHALLRKDLATGITHRHRHTHTHTHVSIGW